MKSLLSSHMVCIQYQIKYVINNNLSQALLEEQLSDDREWAFDTTTVVYGDLTLYAVYGWIIRFRGMPEVLSADKFPKANAVSSYYCIVVLRLLNDISFFISNSGYREWLNS